MLCLMLDGSAARIAMVCFVAFMVGLGYCAGLLHAAMTVGPKRKQWGSSR